MSSGKRAGAGGQEGFAYVLILLLVAVIGATLAAYGEAWSRVAQRHKEAELLWVGGQFRQAIALYYQRTPGAARQYPENLGDLLEDKRYLSTQRYLRRIYRDPITGKAQWGLVPAPGGGIMGVYSLSRAHPLRTGGFPPPYETFATAHRYSDWTFIYEPPVAQTDAPFRR